jgi:hypothetical protein
MSSRISARGAFRAAACLSVLAAAAAVSAPAFATSTEYMPDNCGISAGSYYDGNACSGGLMYYYHPDLAGATASLVGDVANQSADPYWVYSGGTGTIEYYRDYVFSAMVDGDTDGANQGVRNDAASVLDDSSAYSYTVYYYTNYSGHAQTVGPDHWIDFDSTLRNANASQTES